MTVDHQPARRRWTPARGLLVLLAMGLIALCTGGLLRLDVAATVDSFLAPDDPAVAELSSYARSFGGDPVVVILRSEQPRGLLTGDGQLVKEIQLEGRLASLPDVAAVYGPGTILNQIATVSQNLLVRIGASRDAIRARAEARARASGASGASIAKAADAASAAFDRRYGALITQGMPAGLPTMRNPRFAEAVIFDKTGEPRPRWSFVVPDAHAIAILVRPREGLDEDGNARLVSAVRGAVRSAGLHTSQVTVTGIPVITSALAAEAVGEMPLLGGLAALVLLGRFLGGPGRGRWFRRLRPLVAALLGSLCTLAVFGWLGVALSFAAIALLPLLLGIGSSFSLYLESVASRREVVVVSLASAAAFASLAASPLPFVRDLGLALSLGVVLTVSITILLDRMPGIGREPRRGAVLTVAGHPVEEPARDTGASHGSEPAGSRHLTRRRAALACCVLLAAAGWIALPRLDVVAHPEVMAHGLPALRDAHRAEQVLGSSGSVSVVLRGSDVQTPAALAWLVQAQDLVVSRHGDQLRPILTVPDLLSFLGDHPTSDQIAAGVELLPAYLSSAVLTPDRHQAVLSFGLKLQDLGQQQNLLAQVQRSLPEPPPGMSADLVGLPVAAGHSYAAVADGRWSGHLSGIAAAALVLLVGLRHRRDAVAAVVAALLATGWTLVGLWTFGRPLTPLTIMLGSLATVTACEFTVLLAEARRRRSSSLSKVVAWACASSAIGYLALVPSRIALLREFGLTLACALLLSYLAALAVTRLTADPRGGVPGPARGADDVGADVPDHDRRVLVPSS
jgi:predicted RND superfamily exporter protein